jgi:hypothetical protein
MKTVQKVKEVKNEKIISGKDKYLRMYFFLECCL